MMKSFTLASLLLALASVTAFAGPKQKQEAKRHIDRATKLHKDGKFDQALVELQAAYKLDPQIDLLYAIGQVYSKLGKCDDATKSFKEFAAKKKQADVAQIVDQAIATCKSAAPPPEPPPPPAPPPSPPPEPTPPPPPAPVQPAPPPAPPPAPVASVVTHPPPPHTPRPWYRDAVGDMLVGGGVASAIVGLVVYSQARSDLDAAETSSTLARYQDLVDQAQSKRTLSVVLIGGGAALVGAGLVRYMLHDRHHESHGVAVVPTSGGGLVTWTGGF